MANKNFLDEEMLDDEQLDNVSGGLITQTVVDSLKLSQAGLCNMYGFFTIEADPSKVEEIKAGWAKIGVDFEYHENESNKYFMNGKEISNAEAREQIAIFKMNRFAEKIFSDLRR